MRRGAIAALGLLLLTVLVFFDVLTPPLTQILSAPGTDLQSQFVHWRHFGFSELRNGNLPLWNPHIYSGTPFMPGFQSALFYPPNWIFIILPLPVAINISIALHVWLAGLFMYAWARARGLHPLAAFSAGVMFMFCGPHYLHIYAGHLSNLCGIVWVPLVFCAIDRIFDQVAKPRATWTALAGPVLLGTTAVCLQVLAGHPQYVYFTGIAAALFAICRMIRHPAPLRGAALVVALYLFGALLASIQLLPGIMAASESVRSSGLSGATVQMFAFAPESLLTLFAPHFFDTGADYWGRSYYWEMSFFFSVSGIALAVLGATVIEGRARWIVLTMIGAMLLLASGHRTPLYPLLRSTLPGLDVFRGASKFTLPAMVFAILLAARGLSHLLNGGRPATATIRTLVAAAVVLGLAAALVYGQGAHPRGWWAQTLLSTFDTGETYHPVSWYRSQEVVQSTAHGAGISLMLAAVAFGAVVLILRCGRPRMYATLPLLIAIELVVFARANRPTFPDVPRGEAPGARRLDANRILNPHNPNAGMTSGKLSLIGYDPGVTKRYAEFVAHAQGRESHRVREQLKLRIPPPLFAMLRAEGAGREPLPQAFVVHDYRVIATREAIFSELHAFSDASHEPLILEREPAIHPEAATGDETVAVRDQGTDHLVIDVDLTANGILVITDGFSAGWSARTDTGDYDVVPANVVLRAVALPAGQHRVTLRYEPPGYRFGRGLSLVSLAIFAALGIAVLRANRNDVRT